MKHILVAVDGSAHALKAVDLAADLAEKFGARLTFLHVVQDLKVPDEFRHYAETEYRGEPPTAVYLRQVGEVILSQAEKRIAGRKLETKRMLAQGGPPDHINKVADELDVDLIVMGSRGLGPISGFVLGSVSTRVLFQGSRTVLIVK
jgi:nucleotide-binding universal stress UspA family protein